MKKLLSMLSITLLVVLCVTGCSKKKNADETKDASTELTKVRVASLKGPTSLGLLQMMDTEKFTSKKNEYQFEISQAADEILTKVVKGDVDIALVPANVAAILYKQTEGNVAVVDINTLGVLYAVENGDTIQSVADLKGKTICMTGKGTVPEYAFSYILSKNGLTMDDVTVEFKSEPTEVVSYLASDESAIGILPQPFATTATMQDDQLRVALDLNEEWTKVDTDSTYVTGVTIVRKEFLNANKESVEIFMNEHRASVDYVNSNVDEAAAIAEKVDIVKAPVAKQAIPKCNITSITGEDMKNKLSGYLQTLFDSNAKSVGGALPDEAFYYISGSQE